MYYKSVISTEVMTILVDFKWASLDLTQSQMEVKWSTQNSTCTFSDKNRPLQSGMGEHLSTKCNLPCVSKLDQFAL